MATAMFWLAIVCALVGALCFTARVSPAHRFLGVLGMGAGLLGLCASGIVSVLERRNDADSGGLPYSSPLDNFHASDLFAFVAFVLTILVVAIVFMRESTAKTNRYFRQPYTPEELKADLDAIDNEDTRSRLKAMIKAEAQAHPITRARFDELASKADSERAGAAQLAAIDAATQAG